MSSARSASEALRCYAVSAPGLEHLVAAELRALGIDGRADAGGVAWEGDLRSVYQANLWLRTATRVLVRVARFRATTFWELERRAAQVKWASIVAPGATVAFRVTARKSRLYHSDAVAERLAKSVSAAVKGVRIADAPAAAGDADEDEVAPEGPVQLFVVRLARDELTLSADSSGAPLYRRGYRQAVAKAPLRETLAAGLLLGAGWRPGDALLDPFCGSGTIPIEAALMTLGVAPGLASRDRSPRDYAFTRWRGFSAALWQECVDAARSVAQQAVELPIVGSDRDEGAIAAARANAERAGVAEGIGFEVRSVSDLRVPASDTGWVVTNPPYGQRIGDQSDVRRLYAAFGRALFERAQGWNVALLSPDSRLDGITAKEAGVTLQERIRTRNGGIPVRIAASG